MLAEVDDVLAALFTRQNSILAGAGSDCDELVHGAFQTLRRATATEAALCYWGWLGADGEPGPAIANVAAAVQLLSAATVLHHGLVLGPVAPAEQSTVHQQFIQLHARRGWAGDGERFGLAAGVLAGDMCLVWSDELFMSSGMSAGGLARARPVFDRLRTRTLVHQYLSLVRGRAAGPEGRPGQQTGRAGTHGPRSSLLDALLLGAVLAPASSELLRCYTEFGTALGEGVRLAAQLGPDLGSDRSVNPGRAGVEQRIGELREQAMASLDGACAGGLFGGPAYDALLLLAQRVFDPAALISAA